LIAAGITGSVDFVPTKIQADSGSEDLITGQGKSDSC
jgi:hypothetical protein